VARVIAFAPVFPATVKFSSCAELPAAVIFRDGSKAAVVTVANLPLVCVIPVIYPVLLTVTVLSN